MATLPYSPGLAPGKEQTDKAIDRRMGKLFIHATLIACLCLQRFGLILGGSAVFFCLPIFLGLLGLMFMSGRAELRPIPIFLYCLFAFDGIIATLIALNTPETSTKISILSFFSLLTIYICLLFRPSDRFSGRDTIDIFLFYARMIAILGVLQYLAQFAGVRLFSFMLAIPPLTPVLVEPLYNYNPILTYGSNTLRSNGFFLIEPSIFSQLMALGIAVEVFVKRSYKFLPLYAVAYLFSFSGTGLLALAISIVLLGLFDRRNLNRILLFVVVVAALMGIMAVAFPDQFNSLAGRAGEAQYEGSSGYARYFAQFDTIKAYLGETRTIIGYGPGGMERSAHYIPGSGNPALKLFIDYGILGMIAFFAFFIHSIWRKDAKILSLYFLVNFQLGGGSLLFPPLIILIVVLCVWSVNEPARAPA